MMIRRRPPKRTKGLDPKLIEAILGWNGLPIARRYFGDFDSRSVRTTFHRLVKQGDLHAYPPLIERPGAMVAQSEHCLYIHEDGAEVLTA